MPPSDYDWIFDAVMQFFNSPEWDTPIMNFIDDKCIQFDNADENKLEYTMVHQSFVELIDQTLGTFLTRLGISEEEFVEACEKARSSRSINSQVVGQLQSMDDFLAFKKLMVKRNLALELEVMQVATTVMPNSNSSSGDGDEVIQGEVIDGGSGGGEEEGMQDAIDRSLMELEMIHKVSFVKTLT